MFAAAGDGGSRRRWRLSGLALSHGEVRRADLVARCGIFRETVRRARALLAQVERATPRSLGQLGGRLYRLQHASAGSVSTTEWRRIWSVYQARRGPARA